MCRIYYYYAFQERNKRAGWSQKSTQYYNTMEMGLQGCLTILSYKKPLQNFAEPCHEVLYIGKFLC